MQRTKTCDRCGNSFPATTEHFGENLRKLDRLQPHCRTCRASVLVERRQRKNARSREWAAANREKARESARESYQRHRRSRLAYYRQWREENKERIREYQRQRSKEQHGDLPS